MINNKILIITYYWPPSGGSGVQRWLNFSNNLVDMGYDVTVLTAEFPNYPLTDQSLNNYINPLIKILKVPVFEPAKFFKSKKNERVILLTTKSADSYTNFKFESNDTLLFGRESAGVPDHVHNSIKYRLKIPMMDNKRSLNIASSVAIILSENLRQTNINK
jgi:tRNA (cytidine/uridine-2'-O-)-methyltransferase